MKLLDQIESNLTIPYKNEGSSNYVWCLDNGHGRFTPGKRCDEFREYEFNRWIARRVAEKLLQANVSYFLVVPEDDTDDFLSGRVARANKLKSNTVFVSIHSNAGPGEYTLAKGIETFSSQSFASKYMADAFQRALVNELGWIDRGVKDGNHLYVVRKTKMPAVLLEVGFFNNINEKAKLMNPDVRERIAIAIFKAILLIEEKKRF